MTDQKAKLDTIPDAQWANWAERMMAFDPADYGDAYTKRTLLWGRFNPPMKAPVEAVEGSKMHLMSPSPDRQARRSETPMGFARAFFEANQ